MSWEGPPLQFKNFALCGLLTPNLCFSLKHDKVKGGPGASGRVLPPMTGRSRVRVAVSSHCIGEGKACHWHPSPDPAHSGSSLHWVRPFFSRCIANILTLHLSSACFFLHLILECSLYSNSYQYPIRNLILDY